MTTNVFINLAVTDLERSMNFFRHCGFTFNPQFTDEKAACMIVSTTGFVMLLRKDFFEGFTPKNIINSHTDVECLTAVSVESREQVDQMYTRALEAGGSAGKEAVDHGFMYQRSFQDPDGHWWEVLWMDPTHTQS